MIPAFLDNHCCCRSARPPRLISEGCAQSLRHEIALADHFYTASLLALLASYGTSLQVVNAYTFDVKRRYIHLSRQCEVGCVAHWITLARGLAGLLSDEVRT